MKDVTALVRKKKRVTKNITEIHSLSSKRKDSSIQNRGTDFGTRQSGVVFTDTQTDFKYVVRNIRVCSETLCVC